MLLRIRQTIAALLDFVSAMPRTKFLCDILDESFYQTSYRDRRNSSSSRELNKSLLKSTTLYVGNLSFYTREEQIWELFSRAGEVRRVIMGLHRLDKTPCGFCFVEFENRDGAEMAMRYINHCRLDDRIIRTDWDAGFVEGRQFGRGRSGGQVRDEFRKDYDADRGGYGKMVQRMIQD